MHKEKQKTRLPVTEAVILCGGSGSRLGAIGLNCPKCLLRVTDRPLLFEHLSLFSAYGVTDAYLTTGVMASRIQAAVRTECLSLRAHFVHANGTGTGGALLRAQAELPKNVNKYWVSMGDIVCRPDLGTMYKKMLDLDIQAVILGVHVPNSSQYGMLVTDEKGILIDFREKQSSGGPGLVDAGFYLFTRDFLSEFEHRRKLSLEYEVFPNVGRVAVVRHTGIWHDIGSIWRLREARRDFTQSNKQKENKCV